MVYKFLTIAWRSDVWPGGLPNELSEDYLRKEYEVDSPEAYVTYWRRQLFPRYGVYHIT